MLVARSTIWARRVGAAVQNMQLMLGLPTSSRSSVLAKESPVDEDAREFVDVMRRGTAAGFPAVAVQDKQTISPERSVRWA